METRVYACYNRNDDIRSKSSSGGIYYLLAREVLCNGGVVFAACYDGLDVTHKRIDDENALLDSLGSKYMPSELADTFTAVKNELINGRTVLFTGIPCQCGGLLSYMKNCNTDCTNLITVDVICHGVPSKKAWNSYCDSLSATGFNMLSVNMRDKSSGWKSYSWRLTDTKGTSRTQRNADNPYMKGFISDIYLHPSCSNCRFKGIERNTDITLGDYWEVNKVQPDVDDDKGTSLVIVHSAAGQELFDAVSESVVRTSALVEEAVKHNPSVVTSSVVSDKRTDFFRRLAEGEDFCDIVEELTKKPVSVQMKRKAKSMIKKIVRGGGELFENIKLAYFKQLFIT
ncbi:MAG: Coenzyme F420 hydrogenase/dehydrogenase, beta subunit C-terminal domain [Oscillospiraceae bacterium]|nr:Coenzyme F420 hydrogenase/dehydrogenase, beta subunit C-terminal domain [Oscillospiraceae bacterium]